ncbi:galectin-1 [Ctenodactylus gundi]
MRKRRERYDLGGRRRKKNVRTRHHTYNTSGIRGRDGVTPTSQACRQTPQAKDVAVAPNQNLPFVSKLLFLQGPPSHPAVLTPPPHLAVPKSLGPGPPHPLLQRALDSRQDLRQAAQAGAGRLGLAGVDTGQGLVAHLNLQPGEYLKVQGLVAPDAKSFVLNLGKDKDNLCLHFNPRFNAHGDVNTLVCNSKDAGAWGAEHREPAFPFLPGTLTEVCVSFTQADLTIRLPDDYEFKFPNRLNLDTISYMATDGDFKVKCVTFD